MQHKRMYVALATILTLGFTLTVAAITTVSVKVVCPICQTENDFYDYGSWGSYIYSWPSKFQLVFWPQTSSSTIYSCKKCHLTLYMWDFKKFPKDKIRETVELLKTVKLSGSYKSYTDIPASEKLQIAEKVYRLLGKDDAFWADFYRVQGYHLARDKRAKEAAEARQRALEITQRMLADPTNGWRKKELLVP